VPEIRLLELRNTYKWGGGPDKTILLSAERHDRANLSVVVAYVRDASDHEFCIADKARARGLTFYDIPERGKFDPHVIRAIRDIVVRHDINLIHAHDYKSDLFAYLAQRWLRKQRFALLSTAHAWVMLGLRGELYRRLDLWLMRRFDHLIAVSHATKAEMVAAGLAASNISVIHNAIDGEAWSPSRATQDLRKELGLEHAFPVIGYVGRIMPEKDLETWLRTVAVVAGKYPGAKFVLVGEGRDGTTQQQLQRLAATLGIAQRVIFTGYRDTLQPAYASFDLFMLSSRREGLPNSILEAMAMGLPVVTTDVAGAKELVIDSQTGFVLPQGDVHGLAQAVLTLVDNDSLRLRMGQAGRERVEGEFSFTQRLQRVEELYRTILGISRTCHASILARRNSEVHALYPPKEPHCVPREGSTPVTRGPIIGEKHGMARGK
jgi:glycosyltransferase involved in cell wall biosynthesis